MIISHKHKFIYSKSIKTAGTSVQIALAKQCGEQDIVSGVGGLDGKLKLARNDVGYGPHTIPRNIRGQVGKEIWDSYLKIINVRNPWDVMVSWYHWNHESKSFSEWLKNLQHWPDNNNFYFDKDGTPYHDFIIRFETLEEDYRILCEVLGIPHGLGHFNKRVKTKHYSTYYTQPWMIDLVGNYFSDIIKHYKYKFEQA